MKIHTRIVIDIASGNVIEDHWTDYGGPVALCKSETTNTPGPLDPEMQRLLGVGADIGQQQLNAIIAQGGMQNMLYGMLPGLMQGLGNDLGISGLGMAPGGGGGVPQIGGPSPQPASAPAAAQPQQRAFTALDALTRPGALKLGMAGGAGGTAPGINSYVSRFANQGSGTAVPGGGAMFAGGTPGFFAPGGGGGMGGLNMAGSTLQAPGGAGGGIESELQNMQLNLLRGGGQATPQDIALINEMMGAQLQAGESDIGNFANRMFSDLRQELAPQLGLRPGDSPILDRGGRIAEEAIRQQGQLATSLRGQGAGMQLQFPLQRTAAMSPQIGAARSFEEQLRQQAFANRANMLQTIGGFGLGLSGQGPSAVPNVAQGSTSETFDPFKAAAGIGAGLGYLFPSSRRFKENGKPVDLDQILAAIEDLAVERWNYADEEIEHIGPYAEDFKRAFGIGDGATINVLDAIGVLMAAVKALAARVEAVHA